MKISFIGCGAVAETTAFAVSIKKIFNEIVLLDINESRAKGKSIDLNQSSILDNFNQNIKATSDYENLKYSDVIVITAGASNKPGEPMNRESLLSKNNEIISSVALNLKKIIPTDEKQPLIIMVTNPLDSILKTFIDIGFNKRKTIGSGNWLDTARFKYYLSKDLNIPFNKIETMVIGQHGESMVYLLSQTKIDGELLENYIENNSISKEKIDDICQKSTRGGYEIISLIVFGGTMYGPAMSVVNLIDAYLEKTKDMVIASIFCNGEYGFNDVCLGLPILLDKNGVKEVITLNLSENEKTKLQKTYEIVNDLNIRK